MSDTPSEDQLQKSGHRRPTKGPKNVVTKGPTKDVKKSAEAVARTVAGQDFLRWIMEYCGFKYSSLTMTEEGVLLADAVIHNEAKRAVWLDIRKQIPIPLLNAIEAEREEIHVS